MYILTEAIIITLTRGWKAWLFRHPYVLIIMMPLILAFVQETVGGDNSHEDLQIAAINEQLGNLAKVSSPGAFLAYELSISAFPLQDAADEVSRYQLCCGRRHTIFSG